MNALPAAALAAVLLAAPAAAWAADRFAVVVGNDRGAPGRARLWFAESDAERFARALTELGDFPAANVRVVTGGTAAQVRSALQAAEGDVQRAREAGARALLLVYYSGHAGSQGLELGGERLPFDELKRAVEGSAAETKVAIVDACEAGALTQVKGARASPEVDFPLPVEDSARGVAFIASTAVGEPAQESAQLGGSFFTHNLELALRGAGDADGDGQVTLAEAFRYTAAQTVDRTAGTETGPQHPTYDFRMAGRGDVVLADLRRAQAELALPAGGSWLVKGGAGVLYEVPGGVTLALPAGRYDLERRSSEGRFVASVELAKGARAEAGPLRRVAWDASRPKGGSTPTELFAGVALATPPLGAVGPLPGVRIGARREAGPVAVQLTVELDRGTAQDAGLYYRLTSVRGTAAVLWPLYPGTPWIEAGPEIGAAWHLQSLDAGRSASAAEGFGGAAVAVGLPVGPVRLGLQSSLGARLLAVDGTRAVRLFADGALIVAVGI